MIYFSAGIGVSLAAEFDEVRGQFPENVLLTTKNHHIGMVTELVQPANSAGRRLHELATCPETVVIYFSASRGVSLVAEFDKVRGQFPEKVLLTTEIHRFMVAELMRPNLLSPATITRACHVLGDGRDIFQRGHRCLLGSRIRRSARSVS